MNFPVRALPKHVNFPVQDIHITSRIVPAQGELPRTSKVNFPGRSRELPGTRM